MRRGVEHHRGGARDDNSLGGLLVHLRFSILTAYITILFNGYSTIPLALASFNFGSTSRTMLSSRIVFTATHSRLLSSETVGLLSAGSTASTCAKSDLRTLSIRPTRPCASMAPRSISATFSIFLRFSADCQAFLLAIS